MLRQLPYLFSQSSVSPPAAVWHELRASAHRWMHLNGASSGLGDGDGAGDGLAEHLSWHEARSESQLERLLPLLMHWLCALSQSLEQSRAASGDAKAAPKRATVRYTPRILASEFGGDDGIDRVDEVAVFCVALGRAGSRQTEERETRLGE